MQTYHRATVSTSCVWLLAAVTSAAAGQPATTSECVSDLEAAEVLLRRNYAGYAIAADAGAGGLDAAMSSARGAADNATGVACDEAIRGFLAEFKDGHLLLGSQFSPPVDMPPPLFMDKREPVARPINDGAFLLRVPSFAIGFKRDVDSLLEKNRAAIQSRETLVVDVRGNTGGGDSTWTNIIDPIYSGPMKRWGIKWRPTDDNAGAIEKQVEELRKSGQGSASVCNGMQQVADEMRTHLDETLAALGPQLPTTVTLPEVWPSPRRVAIIVDGSCGSSCENFLLAARQSEKVTVFGETTYGAIDFQNVRIAKLPSGKRDLYFAMSMSDRVLALKQRRRGLSPDRRLSADVLRNPDAAIEHVLRDLAASAVTAEQASERP